MVLTGVHTYLAAATLVATAGASRRGAARVSEDSIVVGKKEGIEWNGRIKRRISNSSVVKR